MQYSMWLQAVVQLRFCAGLIEFLSKKNLLKIAEHSSKLWFKAEISWNLYKADTIGAKISAAL